MAYQGTGTLRWKQIDSSEEDRKPGDWIRVEEQSQAGVTRKLMDEKVGKAVARVTVIEARIKAADAPLRGARARATRAVNRMLEDLGGLTPEEIARAICSRP